METALQPIRAIVVWGNWGPYHYHRFSAFRNATEERGWQIRGLELYGSSGYYDWRGDFPTEGMVRFDLGPVESRFHPLKMTSQVITWLIRFRPHIAFLPSYWHWSLYLNIVARFIGCRVIMMNESHAGTERASGWRRQIKSNIVRRFHAALVGGQPHRRYFASLGLPEEKIVPGYDAVDNGYYERESDNIRRAADKQRHRLALPRKYILNLGRFVPKKNLETLVEAFARLTHEDGLRDVDLVLVGSGEEEDTLKSTASRCGLAVRGPVAHGEPEGGSVRFYGFRQIEESPAFYALASAFVLPSHYEEWGLVINEAMACGLPVVVSKTLGCAEDLVADGDNGFHFDPGSPQELSGKLKQVLADPDLAAKMGRRSRERIAEWGLERFADGAMRAAEIALGKDPEAVGGKRWAVGRRR